MKLLCLLLVCWLHAAYAQVKLPLIKANSTRVSIRDGDNFDKNVWRLSPSEKPDIYMAERTRKKKWVTFYTDIDSIRIKIKPGSIFDCVILLNGKDSCFTRIVSAIPKESATNTGLAMQDTLPFTVSSNNAISFTAIINDRDSVLLHFDTGSWDVHLTKKAIIEKTGLLPGHSSLIASDFGHLGKVNRLRIGSWVIDNPVTLATELTAYGMDGRFGWNLFEGKQIELDYNKNILIVHAGKFPKLPKGYSKTSLAFKHSFMIIKGKVLKGKRKYPANFVLDTGSEQAMIIDSGWSASTGFAEGQEVFRKVTLYNPRGTKFQTSVVRAQALELAGFYLFRVPALLLGYHNPVGFSVNTLGNDVLRRFNVILDFKHDLIYWKPNHLFMLAYNNT